MHRHPFSDHPAAPAAESLSFFVERFCHNFFQKLLTPKTNMKVSLLGSLISVNPCGARHLDFMLSYARKNPEEASAVTYESIASLAQTM